MTENDLHTIIADVAQRYGVPELGANEFTIALFAQARQLSYNAAVTIIRRGLAAGGIVAVGPRRTASGHTAQAFRLVSRA